jgi:hypothetical protein
MRRGQLHAGLLCAMFIIAIAVLANLGQAGTDWMGGGKPSVSPTPIPPAPGAPTTDVSLVSADTTAPKAVAPATTSAKAVECVQQVECVQTQCVQVPVRTVRYYNVVSAAPVMHNVGCVGQAANVGCQRVGLLNRFRARRALFRANAHAYAAVGCGG